MFMSEKTLKCLKEMLDDKQRLIQYRGYGHLYKTTCSFNPPVEEDKIESCQRDLGFKLPDDYKYFLMIHNGARLFQQMIDGENVGGGLELYTLENLNKEYINTCKYLGEKFLPIAQWEDEDRVFINLEDVEMNNRCYLYLHSIGDPEPLKLNFDLFLDRYIVAQGAFFIEWRS